MPPCYILFSLYVVALVKVVTAEKDPRLGVRTRGLRSKF